VSLRIDDHHQPVEEIKSPFASFIAFVYSHNHCDRYFPFQHYLERICLGC
jgi:hypothetical protein